MITNENLANEIFEKVDRFFEVNLISDREFTQKFLYNKPYKNDIGIALEPGVMKGYVYIDYENTIYIPIQDYEKDKVSEKEIVYIRVKSLICSILTIFRKKAIKKYNVDDEIMYVAKMFKDNYIINAKVYNEILGLRYDSDRIELLAKDLVNTIIEYEI